MLSPTSSPPPSKARRPPPPACALPRPQLHRARRADYHDAVIEPAFPGTGHSHRYLLESLRAVTPTTLHPLAFLCVDALLSLGFVCYAIATHAAAVVVAAIVIAAARRARKAKVA